MTTPRGLGLGHLVFPQQQQQQDEEKEEEGLEELSCRAGGRGRGGEVWPLLPREPCSAEEGGRGPEDKGAS